MEWRKANIGQNCDKLQSVCWGRPSMIKATDFDVHVPIMKDFDHPTVGAEAFIQTTNLCIIVGFVTEQVLQHREVQHSNFSAVTEHLQHFIENLPTSLHLYDETGQRKQYCRPASEVHILYFVCIILLEGASQSGGIGWCPTATSILASSCAIRLYEEIEYRGHVNLLVSIHVFFCLVAAVPQIFHRPGDAAREDSRRAEVEILCSVLRTTIPRYPGAQHNLDKIRRLMTRSSANGDVNLSAGAAADHLYRLFPFPNSMCDNMEILQQLQRSIVATCGSTDMPEEDPQELPIDLNSFFDLFSWNWDGAETLT